MNSFLNGLKKFFSALLDFLKLLLTILPQLLRFLRGLWAAARRCFRKPDRGGCCLDLPPSVHLRADPMLYSQSWLMSQGLAVTWDNPDIQIYDMVGNAVEPVGLIPDQDYQVVVRIWNNSYGGPAAGLGVNLSFIRIGFGNTQFPIGVTTANLGVKGSAHCPAFAKFIWHTPAAPGHYCLLALLIWPDDANPNNNLGQKNTLVGVTHSPAQFVFTITNDVTVTRRFQLEADMYTIPVLPRCSDAIPPRGVRAPAANTGRFAESQARWAAALRTQAYGMFPVTAEWKVVIAPQDFDLAPGNSQDVNISIEFTSGTFTGLQPFNIHGFATPPHGPRKLVGGVTLNVQGS
jgi:hypothetical protein